MARIVIDNRISGTTTGRYSDKLVEHLHTISPKHEIIVLTHADRMDFVRKTAPSFTVVESNFADFSFGEQIGLNKQLRDLRADLVHFPMVQQPILYRKPKVTSMLDLTTTRYVNPLKNQVVFKFKQQIYKLVNLIAARSSRHIITISNYVRQEIIAQYHIPAHKITTTHNAADRITEKAEPFRGLEDSQFIFYTGRPQPHKNLQRLIEAFVILQKEFPELKLVLGGKKDTLYEQHAQYVKEQGIRGVVFTDFVSEGQLRWLYEHTQVYVFPSLSEGFGLPGLEAMMHGAAVASSNATCLPEIYQDAAYYFDPMSVADMAQKISEILNSPKLKKELQEKGSKLVRTYSWKRMAEQTLAIYEKCLTK